jgi:hypothetical protein
MGVILVAVALLFMLTVLALAASGRLGHPLRVLAPLVLALALGLVLLLE